MEGAQGGLGETAQDGGAPFLVDRTAIHPAPAVGGSARGSSTFARVGEHLARAAMLAGVVFAVYLAQRSATAPSGELLAAPAEPVVEQPGPAEPSATGRPVGDDAAAGADARAGATPSTTTPAVGGDELGSDDAPPAPDGVDRAIQQGRFDGGGPTTSAVAVNGDATTSTSPTASDAPTTAAPTSTIADTSTSSTVSSPATTSSTTAPQTTTTSPPPTTRRTTTTRPTTTTRRTTTTRPTTTTTTTTAPPAEPPPPPDGCEVQTHDDGSRGVEIKYRSESAFAPSFNLYASNGHWVTSTLYLTEDVGDRVFSNGLYEREWPLYLNRNIGYEPREIYFVAAVDDNGLVSAHLRCLRR